MERRLIWAVAIGIGVMALTVWLLYPGHRPAQVSKEKARFMYCPDCAKEWIFDRRRFEEGCPRCGEKHHLVPTEASILKGDAAAPVSPLARLIAPLLVEGNLLLTVILYLNRRKPARPEGAEQLRMRCHRCHQKIRYPEDKIGWQGRCPRCKTVVTFTRNSEAEQEEENEEENG